MIKIKTTTNIYNGMGDLITKENKDDHVLIVGAIATIDKVDSPKLVDIAGAGLSGCAGVIEKASPDTCSITNRFRVIQNLIECDSGNPDDSVQKMFAHLLASGYGIGYLRTQLERAIGKIDVPISELSA